MSIKLVGIVGFGTMGSGIAQICAKHEYNVMILEVAHQLLKNRLLKLNDSLSKSVEEGRLTQHDKQTISGQIKGTIDIQEFYSCDLIIEAVTDNIETKTLVFAKLDKFCAPHTIFASNTSCLSVRDIAISTNRTDKVLGMHFLNPAPINPLVEISRTLMTSEQTLGTCREFCTSLGKSVSIIKDTPGFIVNRLLIPFLLNAIQMLESGATNRDEIDTSIELGL